MKKQKHSYWCRW